MNRTIIIVCIMATLAFSVAPSGYTAAEGDVAAMNPGNAAAYHLIEIIDVSKSARPFTRELKAVAIRLLREAPEGATISIVAVGDRAVTHRATTVADAEAIIERLSLDGNRSDLELGVITGLAEVERVRAERTVVALLSDGKIDLSVPDKTQFEDVLVREFSARPSIRVVFVRVGNRVTVGTLPSNVSVRTPDTWGEAATDSGIWEDFGAAFAPAAVVNEASAASTASDAAPTWPLIVSSAAIAVLALLWFVLRRRRQRQRPSESVDVLRAEDFEEPIQPEIMASALEVRHVEKPGLRLFPIGAGEHLVIGSSPAADLCLPGLVQPFSADIRCVSLMEIEIIRRRPAVAGRVDSVRRAGQETRESELRLRACEPVEIGPWRLMLTVTRQTSSSSEVPILENRTDSAASL